MTAVATEGGMTIGGTMIGVMGAAVTEDATMIVEATAGEMMVGGAMAGATG